MSAFTDLLALPEDRLPGSFHTAHEIAQQPQVWTAVLDLLERRAPEIAPLMDDEAAIVLAGAGSSDFVGRSVAATLQRRTGREVMVVPTTHLVTHPRAPFRTGRTYLVVHFARSGDSPESLAAFRATRSVRPDARHLVITCNESGALRRAGARDPATTVITLPPETNDRSLAMTSSFTGMALCAIGLGWLDAMPELRGKMAPVQAAARWIIGDGSDRLREFGEDAIARLCYLGTDCLEGAMCEGALKMLEMTEGRVLTSSNSFLGIRHGPLVFIDEQTGVVACLSSEPRVRRYELDLLRELRGRHRGRRMLAICTAADPEVRACATDVLELATGATAIEDGLRIFTDLVVCQLLAFFKSRACGCAPDNPSPSGLINRVVQGVTIYED